jgi:hypothetical protein
VHKEEQLLDLVAQAVVAYDPDILVSFQIQKIFLVVSDKTSRQIKYERLSCLPNLRRESAIRMVPSKKLTLSKKPQNSRSAACHCGPSSAQSVA